MSTLDHFAALHAAADRLDCQMLAITFRVEANNRKCEAILALRQNNRSRALRLLREADDLREQAETIQMRMAG